MSMTSTLSLSGSENVWNLESYLSVSPVPPLATPAFSTHSASLTTHHSHHKHEATPQAQLSPSADKVSWFESTIIILSTRIKD
jgi:hypothetical protein